LLRTSHHAFRKATVVASDKEAEKRGHRDVMRYSADADRRSFQALVNFLEEIFA
jgi:hypothetical protein